MTDEQALAANKMRVLLLEYIQTHPAFRSKPVGAPHSDLRNLQQLAISLEDDAKQAIVDFEGRT